MAKLKKMFNFDSCCTIKAVSGSTARAALYSCIKRLRSSRMIKTGLKASLPPRMKMCHLPLLFLSALLVPCLHPLSLMKLLHGPQDYRPISLTHSVAKILGKLLASRIAPELQHIISASQSAFLRGRSIQDNFLYVQNLIQSLHRAKMPSLFLKLDIAKAFDSVKWDYLLDVLKHVGFSQRFRDMIAISLASTSSRIILNGAPGAPFLHRRGLRQGDPLSPLLFVLAIDPLQRILERATEEQILSPINHHIASVRISLYADDAALFVNPIKAEVTALQSILDAFGEVSGLCTNFRKSAAYPIGCEDNVIEEVLAEFEGEISSLPCKYLGLPLSLRRLRRVDFQILIDKIAAKLAGWKGKLLSKMGRLALINSVLTSLTTYYLTIFAPTKWIIKRIDKLRRSFLWKGEEEASGGHCAVNWQQVCSPKKLGGLGIKNLCLYSRSLRLRWAWISWKSPSRPWVGSQIPCSSTDMQLFNASTIVKLGNGKKAKFWSSAWLNGTAPKDLAPNLHKLARRKNTSVADALLQGRWMKGLERLNNTEDLLAFIDLWHRIQQISLVEQPDNIEWRWNENKTYTAASAYDAQFIGSIEKPDLNAIWKVKVEGKIKFFAWLLAQNRLPTADRLRARGCEHNDTCSLCYQTIETAAHLICTCPFAKEVWHKLTFTLPNIQLQSSLPFTSTIAWWRCFAHGQKSKAAAAIYFAWNIWNERNRRIFQNLSSTADMVACLIRSDLTYLEVASSRQLIM